MNNRTHDILLYTHTMHESHTHRQVTKDQIGADNLPAPVQQFRHIIQHLSSSFSISSSIYPVDLAFFGIQCLGMGPLELQFPVLLQNSFQYFAMNVGAVKANLAIALGAADTHAGGPTALHITNVDAASRWCRSFVAEEMIKPGSLRPTASWSPPSTYVGMQVHGLTAFFQQCPSLCQAHTTQNGPCALTLHHNSTAPTRT